MATNSQIIFIVTDNATRYYSVCVYVCVVLRHELKIDVRNTGFEDVRWRETASSRA
jgi:hypothetical protein